MRWAAGNAPDGESEHGKIRAIAAASEALEKATNPVGFFVATMRGSGASRPISISPWRARPSRISSGKDWRHERTASNQRGG